MQYECSSAAMLVCTFPSLCLHLCLWVLLPWLYTHEAWLMHAACMSANCAIQRYESWTQKRNSDVSKILMSERVQYSGAADRGSE